ncbi:MAG TPA: 2Fe-2S iron-sulfur cluster-binding protein [Bacteroidia bacterium]|jgi:2Fe-2S ferredoxin|nr:2Fe-2S iron-sulfur cluster-binding protein [Bacteroidia bacterium]
MKEIKIKVIDKNNQTAELTAPSDLGLSLMEFLKASGYPILATCGGMALCATCHIEVLSNYDKLPEPSNDELNMLDTLPEVFPTSRLSCQIKLTENTPDLEIKIRGELEGE